MTPTLTQMYEWFNEYNNLVFNGQLQRVSITFNNTRRQLGQFHWGGGRLGIKISLYYDRPEIEYRNTLLHEMCHLYCHQQGFVQEHHGPNWKRIAAKAGRITGMNITRVHEGSSNWPVASRNKAKESAVRAKRNAPSIIVDLEYPTYHFIVKTTAKVLQSNDSTTWDCKLKTSAKSYKVYIADDALFTRMQSSRSIHRGYRYGFLDYENRIAPKLSAAREVTSLCALFAGKYDKYLRVA